MPLRINRILLYIMLFILLYDVQPIIMGKVFNLPFIILCVFSLRYFLQYHQKIIDINQLRLILVASIFLIVCIVGGLVHQTFPHDVGFSYFYVQLILIIMGLASLIQFYKDSFKNELDFMKFVIYLGVGQAVIGLLMFLNAGIREAIVYRFLTNARVFFENNEMRGFGISTSTTFNLTIIQSLFLFLIAYIIGKLTYKKLIVYSVFYILICVSVLFAGRTGLMGIALSLLYILLYSIWGENKHKYRAFILYMLGMVMVVGINLSLIQNELTLNWFQWAFEFIYNYKESGKLTTQSTTEMLQMYKVFPDNALTFLFGDGRTIETTYNSWFQTFLYYKQVDIGYLRMIFYYGFIFTVAHYSLYIYLIYKATSYNTNVRILGIFLTLYVLIIEAKGLILTSVSMNIIIIGMYMIYLRKQHITKSANEQGENYA
ncbi:hypothetical protein BK702_27615 [Bacillus thuringiensis serovar cameroun]|nr:hypothetical protein BK702_27615 [Bacillus thuringiensis serovar cameroun]